MIATTASRPLRRVGRWGGVGRVAAATLVLAIGFYAASQSFALTIRQSATDWALALAPRNARILTLHAEALAANTTSLPQWRRAADVAGRALRRDPLLPSAAATLGFSAGLGGDNRAAQRAFAYSQTVSRRDLKTHLWAIEYAVSQGDITGALRHYDLALRTSRQAPAILFPVLADAVASDDVRRGLVPLLLRRSDWAAPFVNFVANASTDHRSAAALFGDLRARRFVFPNGAEASLLGALATSRDYETARRYLTQGADQGVSGRSRSPRFASNPATPSPFDWNLQNEVGMTTSIQQEGQGGMVVFAAVAGTGGPILRQLQLLRPGRYEVVSRLIAATPSDARLFWTVQCVDGAELARLPVTIRQGPPGSDGQFTVGPGCPAQTLTLAVAPSDQVGGVTGEIDYAQVRPVGGR